MNNNCQYFVKRKKRFCRMTVKTGHKYCGEHEQNNENLEEKRIPCPLDNKHTCFASKLTKHLKVCNAKIDVLPTYIKKNFNAEKIIETSGNYVEQTSERFLSKAPIEDVKNVLTKISVVYNAVIKGKINEKILDYELLTNEILNPEFGFTTKKHLTQTSSILGHLQNAELLKPNTSFIEFGAGKGKLSFWLAKSTENISDTSIVLVDKASHRHKMDNKLKIENCSAQERIHRIRGDILDLDLSQIDVIRKSKHVIGLTKHLCGVATDYAMRCLENLHKDCNNVTGILMSFCCHHRCLWRDYVGKQFLLKNDFSPQEFDIMCGIVSWATSGVGMSKEKRKELEELSQKSLSSTTAEFDRNKELGLSRDEKTEYGKMAKLLLDYGRMEFLKSLGFNCYLYYYVKPEISLENVLIVATK